VFLVLVNVANEFGDCELCRGQAVVVRNRKSWLLKCVAEASAMKVHDCE